MDYVSIAAAFKKQNKENEMNKSIDNLSIEQEEEEKYFFKGIKHFQVTNISHRCLVAERHRNSTSDGGSFRRPFQFASSCDDGGT